MRVVRVILLAGAIILVTIQAFIVGGPIVAAACIGIGLLVMITIIIIGQRGESRAKAASHALGEADALLKHGRFAEAIDSLDSLLSSVSANNMQMRALTLRALAHRALGKPESAIADCLRAVDLIPMKPIGKMVDTPTLRRLSRESWAMTQQVAVLGHELATQSGKTREAELFWKRIETSRELLAKFGI